MFTSEPFKVVLRNEMFNLSNGNYTAFNAFHYNAVGMKEGLVEKSNIKH